MTAGESGEYELSCVGMARMDRQLRAFTSHRANLIHVREIQQRVHALTVEIHRHGHDVHVARALAIANSVPSTRSAPAITPSSAAATAQPRSLWVCREMISASRFLT